MAAEIGEKVWGTTQLVMSGPGFEVHRLVIKDRTFCSMHKHENKFNGFYVESGSILINVGALSKWGKEYPPAQYILNAGDELVVEPGFFHQFEAFSDAVVYESYWRTDDQALEEDIFRLTLGGKR